MPPSTPWPTRISSTPAPAGWGSSQMGHSGFAAAADRPRAVVVSSSSSSTSRASGRGPTVVSSGTHNPAYVAPQAQPMPQATRHEARRHAMPAGQRSAPQQEAPASAPGRRIPGEDAWHGRPAFPQANYDLHFAEPTRGPNVAAAPALAPPQAAPRQAFVVSHTSESTSRRGPMGDAATVRTVNGAQAAPAAPSQAPVGRGLQSLPAGRSSPPRMQATGRQTLGATAAAAPAHAALGHAFAAAVAADPVLPQRRGRSTLAAAPTDYGQNLADVGWANRATAWLFPPQYVAPPPRFGRWMGMGGPARRYGEMDPRQAAFAPGFAVHGGPYVPAYGDLGGAWDGFANPVAALAPPAYGVPWAPNAARAAFAQPAPRPLWQQVNQAARWVGRALGWTAFACLCLVLLPFRLVWLGARWAARTL